MFVNCKDKQKYPYLLNYIEKKSYLCGENKQVKINNIKT